MNANEIPLGPGDVAIRFRIGYRARKTGGATNYLDVVPVVTGLEAVRIISLDGELVTWTNGREARAGSGQLFRHIGHRRELIAASAFETLCAAPAENPSLCPSDSPPARGMESGAAHPFLP